jgi:hypothetical protein
VPVCTGRWGASDSTPSDASGVQNPSMESLCSSLDAEALASSVALCCVRCLVMRVSYLLIGRWLVSTCVSGVLCYGTV